MKAALELRVLTGQVVVGAVVCSEISSAHSARHVVINGNRRPCALLLCRGDRIDAFTPAGDAMTLAQVETLFPGAAARVMAAVRP